MTVDVMRWRDYFLRAGEQFDAFWRAFLGERKRDILFVIGYGFDPRMCDALSRILQLGGDGARDVALVSFDEGPDSPSHQYVGQKQANGVLLHKLLGSRGTVTHRTITMFSEEGRRVSARSIASVFGSSSEFGVSSDIVVDISALPRGLYLPLLAKMLALFDQQPSDAASRNLHVVVSHSPSTDGAILEEGLEESASYLHGFAAAALESESTRAQPMIWIPVLGRGQQVQLERIHDLVKPDEICPLLPSPADNPREGDALIIEYRDLLFDQLRVEPRNIIYAAESNPFEVYRQIMQSILHYHRALHPLGGCKVAVSAMSSKLASIGVLLAAYELGRRDGTRITVGVAHIESQGYRVEPVAANQRTTALYTMWLAGECYAE
jgi:hypothetical protein